MLSSAVLSYRLGTNSREGKKKKLVWINKWLHLSPPLVCGKLIIHLHTHNHSLLHFLRTSRCPHGTVMAIYRHMRACSLIYACADMKAAGDHEVTGMEGGWRGASPWNTASQERSWASLRRGSDPSHQRERSGACLPEMARGNSICHRSCPNRGTPKTWHWPPKLHNQ